jgi:hypothetical protein
VAKCVHCGADTILYNNGVPVCVDCDNFKERSVKTHTRRKESDKDPSGPPPTLQSAGIVSPQIGLLRGRALAKSEDR